MWWVNTEVQTVRGGSQTQVFSKSLWNKHWSAVFHNPTQTDSSQLLSELNTNLKSQEPGGKKGESENNFSVTEPEMTDQPKKDPGGSKSQWGESPYKWPLACSPFPLQELYIQMAFYWHIWMQSFPSQFYVFILNLAMIISHNTKFPSILFFFSLCFFSYLIVFISISPSLFLSQIWKVRKTLRSYLHSYIVYAQKKISQELKGFLNYPCELLFSENRKFTTI